MCARAVELLSSAAHKVLAYFQFYAAQPIELACGIARIPRDFANQTTILETS